MVGGTEKVLSVACALLLVAGLASAATIDGEDEAGALGDDVAIVLTPTTTSAPPTAPAPELSITPPGRYRQRVTHSGTATEAVVIVEDIGGSPPHQRRTTRPSLGADTVHQVAWLPDGIHLVATGIGGAACVHQPALLEVPRNLTPGLSWSSEGTCELALHSGTAEVTIDGTVRGAELLRIGDDHVATWAVDLLTVVDLHSTLGEFTQRTEGVVWIDPRLGLPIRSDLEHHRTLPGRGGETVSGSVRVVTELVDR